MPSFCFPQRHLIGFPQRHLIGFPQKLLIGASLIAVGFSSGLGQQISAVSVDSLLDDRQASTHADARSARVLEELAGIRFRQRNYAAAEELLKEELQILDAGNSNDKHRIQCLLFLAVVCAKTNRPQDTKEWIAKAKQAEYYPNVSKTFESARTYARIEAEAGLRDDAKADLEQAEKSLLRETPREYEVIKNLELLAELWRKIGNEEKATSLMAKKKDMELLRDKRRESERVKSSAAQQQLFRKQAFESQQLAQKHWFERTQGIAVPSAPTPEQTSAETPQASPQITAGVKQASPQITAGADQASPQITAGAKQASPQITAGAKQASSQITAGADQASPQITAGADQASSHPQASSSSSSSQADTSRIDGKTLGAIRGLDPYVQDMQRRIKRAWFPPAGNEAKRVTVVFKIHKEGELSHLRIARSSGLSIVDQAAITAVQNAAPFRPLPLVGKDEIEIEFTFSEGLFRGHSHGSSVVREF